MKRTRQTRKKPQAAVPEGDADARLLPVEDESDAAEALHEAEADLGISEWIDPDTGAPAEDSVPRIEDH